MGPKVNTEPAIVTFFDGITCALLVCNYLLPPHPTTIMAHTLFRSRPLLVMHDARMRDHSGCALASTQLRARSGGPLLVHCRLGSVAQFE